MPVRFLALVGVVLLLSTACTDSTPDATDASGTASDSIASAAPGTDVYVAALARSDGALTLGSLHNATKRTGYDNQPAFTLDGAALVYTAVQDAQTEVMRYDREADATRPLTDTPQSEYSPTPRPDDRMTLIRVEDDGRQRLWQYSAFGTPAAPVFDDLSPVGYHAWIDSVHVGLFVLGDPPTLHLGHAGTGTRDSITARIGRSLRSIPNAPAISFVKVAADSTTSIHRLMADGSTERLAATPGSGRSVDHTWTPDGTLLMADGTILYAWTPSDDEWRSVADVAPLEPTRLAVSPDGSALALVAQDTPPQ